jgi:hypothetical protein
MSGGADRWLCREDERAFNEAITDLSTQVDEAASRKDFWSAFLLHHSRYDPTIPPFLHGPLESLEDRVLHAWDILNESRGRHLRSDYILQTLKGVCAHIATISHFQSDDNMSERSKTVRVKFGVAFFTRDPPAAATNLLDTYRGMPVDDRLEALVSIFILTMLFGIAGYRPSNADLHVPSTLKFKMNPYYVESFTEKAPDRRSCAQLAAASLRFRDYTFDNMGGSIFKPIAMMPLGTWGGGSNSKPAKKKRKIATVSETEAPPAHFSRGDIRRVAGIPDEAEGHSAAKVLCWFAARIRDFSSVELKSFASHGLALISLAFSW